jgi:hypothetical protein
MCKTAKRLLIVVGCALLLFGCGGDSGSGTGEFSMLIYNVAGLPPILSGHDPEANIPQISPL